MGGLRSVLILSDMHHPYAHADTVAFLAALKKKYRPDKVVSVGDEIDGHAISFHEKDPDLLSPGDELETAIKRLEPLYKLFPEMDLCESNHGSLVYRRARYAGLPKAVIKPYRDVIRAPRGWHWHDDLILKLSDGTSVFICHNRTENVLKNSQAMGMSFVQGHHHQSFEIRYWGHPFALNWAMTVGCLIEKSSLAFAYGKTSLKRPVIGCGLILEGQPKLAPMVLDKNGRWNGVTP